MAFKNYFVDDADVVPEPPMGQIPSYTQEDLPVQDYPREPVVPSYTLEDVVQGPTPEAVAKIAKRSSEMRLDSPIPIKTAPSASDATAPVASTLPSTTDKQPAGKPNSAGTQGLPAPSSEGAGGDAENRLFQGQLLARMAAGLGNVAAGRSTDIGVADMLGERLKQVQALRAKREEQGLTDARERANNRAQVDYLISRFPDRAEDLQKLYGMTGKPNFSQMLRVEEQVALDKARKGEIGAKAEDRAKTQEYRAGTLGLRKDTLEENKRYHDIQAGLKQAELNLRQAENERKATGSSEPTEKERNLYQTSMKPAEKTAVALKDADKLNVLGDGMLVTGKPPAFLSRSDIAAFNGFPLGETSRSMLAQSNPQAYDLLTKMAELKTMVGHEYFGSALSPSEAERQRQFLDFGMMDSPESIARKMKSYHDTLADKASVFLRPRIIGHDLGPEWAQLAGLDALSASGGSFAGLLDAPKTPVAKVTTTKTAPTPGGTAATKNKPSVRSIDALKKDPSALNRQYFDEHFGPGAAKKALGE